MVVKILKNWRDGSSGETSEEYDVEEEMFEESPIICDGFWRCDDDKLWSIDVVRKSEISESPDALSWA